MWVIWGSTQNCTNDAHLDRWAQPRLCNVYLMKSNLSENVLFSVGKIPFRELRSHRLIVLVLIRLPTSWVHYFVVRKEKSQKVWHVLRPIKGSELGKYQPTFGHLACSANNQSLEKQTGPNYTLNIPCWAAVVCSYNEHNRTNGTVARYQSSWLGNAFLE